MAPHSNTLSTFDRLRFNDRDQIKLRKPIVEKMRRDRINSCIDQLKGLLEKEFHSRDPNTKLEKADILEMTVSFLRQQLSGEPAQKDYNEGFSNCWRASIHFLSLHSPGGGSGRELQHFHNAQQARSAMSSTTPASSKADPQQAESRSPVWRPW